jgi:ketopantoate reductase
MNGIRHLSLLTAAFGAQHVLGAATRLIASMSDDGTIAVVVPGIDMQIGLVDGGDTEGVARTLAELETPDIAVPSAMTSSRPCGRSSRSSPRRQRSPALLAKR